jgi:hypothetical protein
MRDPAERIEMLAIARGYMTLADHVDRCQINRWQQKRPHHFDEAEVLRGGPLIEPGGCRSRPPQIL